jgi:hypothetical protein
MKRLKYLALFLSLLSIWACTKDKLKVDFGECVGEITYESDVQEIINTTCAYTGCHIESGAAPGAYNSYSGLEPWLNPNKFQRRVIELRDMPPVYATGPTSLTQDEINILNCWIENNYAEN